MSLRSCGLPTQRAKGTDMPQNMPQSAAPHPQADADRLEAATGQAIAACGGDAREAVRALIVANEFLETEVCELMQAISHAYVRGRFKTYTG
jgi:hypothetical protein